MSLPIRWRSTGPPPLELLLVAAVADRGDVVGQRVEPHVGDVLAVPRQRDAPLQAGAADAEVAQPAADEAEGLVAAELGLDGAGVGGVPVEQAVLEAAEAEEVVLLLEVLDRPLVDRAQVAVERAPRRRSTPRTPRSTCRRRRRARCRRRRSSLQQLWTPILWRASVVRMKSSLLMFEPLPRLLEAGRSRRRTPAGSCRRPRRPAAPSGRARRCR
jgi:hypothetical protein